MYDEEIDIQMSALAPVIKEFVDLAVARATALLLDEIAALKAQPPTIPEKAVSVTPSLDEFRHEFGAFLGDCRAAVAEQKIAVAEKLAQLPNSAELRKAVENVALEGKAAIGELRGQAAELETHLRERADATEAQVQAALALVKDGAPGRDGIDGKPGEQGPAGPPGPQGERGEQGPAGEKGDPGEPGADGEMGPVGPEGQKGEKGDPGPIGLTGEAGPMGPQGEVGPAGPIGDAGPQGDAGVQGPQGDPGPQGKGIEDAFIGRDGELILTFGDGRTKNLGAGFAKSINVDAIAQMVGDAVAEMHEGIWEPDREYRKGKMVVYGGSTFLARADTKNRPAASEDWLMIVQRGRDGRDGSAPKPPRPVIPVPQGDG